MKVSASLTWGVVSSGSTPHSDISCAVPPRAAPRLSRPAEMMSSIAARSATRTGWLYPNGMHSDARRLRRHRGQEDLGRAHVRVLDERVVLDRPHAVEADFLREHRLLHAVADRLAFDIGRAVLDLGLEDHGELHGAERTPGRPGAHRCPAGTLAAPCLSTRTTTSRSPGSSTPSRRGCSRARTRCRLPSRVASARWPTPVWASVMSTASSGSS